VELPFCGALSRLFVEYLHKSSAKIKIVPEYLSWDQEELFDEKKPTLKNIVTLSL